MKYKTGMFDQNAENLPCVKKNKNKQNLQSQRQNCNLYDKLTIQLCKVF